MTKVDKNIQTAQNMLSWIVERCYVLEQENKSLREEILDLKSELSKFSEAYKKYRDYEKEELAESCYDLARENEKLKEEIWKLVMNWK